MVLMDILQSVVGRGELRNPSTVAIREAIKLGTGNLTM